jgi:hypothetical protein
MEGKNVCEIHIMVAFAADMLAGGDFGSASFSDRLALPASVQADRDNRQRIFPVHQGLIHAPRQSPRRLKKLGDVPQGTTL